MQYSNRNLERLALKFLQEEWERMPHPTTTHSKHADEIGHSQRTACPHELSPITAVLPKLIRLLDESCDQSVNKLRPTIKHLILEQLFMEVGGDPFVDAQHMTHVKHYVELTVRVLVRIRQHGVAKDEWTDAPVTPMMFG